MAAVDGKFKVGDRIRHKALGYVGVVERIVDEKTAKTLWDDQGWGGWDPVNQLELVHPAPSSAVRTVTRREIVPGEVTLPSGRDIIVAQQGRYVNVAIPALALDSSDLRAAAALFTELADVLDENSAEQAVAEGSSGMKEAA